MNHGKGHLHTFHHLVGRIFQINTPVINHGKGKLSHLVPWFSCLPFRLWTISNCIAAHADVPGAGRCHELLQSPGVFAQHGQGTPPYGCLYQVTLGHTKSMMVLILKEVMKCLKKIDDIFKMAVILQFDTVSGFILIFFADSGKKLMADVNFVVVCIHSWLVPPQKWQTAPACHREWPQGPARFPAFLSISGGFYISNVSR